MLFRSTGRRRASVINELNITGKEYTKEANKRATKRDEAASKVDLTPGQKQQRLARRADRFEREKKQKASGTAVEVSASEGIKGFTGKPTQIPGEGKPGILNPAAVARTAGTMSGGKRRRMERKAAYNAKKSGATRGYTAASQLGLGSATAHNTAVTTKIEKEDTSARQKAARIDTSKDALKASVLKRATAMPEGEAKTAVQRAGESIIREPRVNGKRGGLHESVTRPDERNITKSYTRVVPVGGVRKTDITEAMRGDKIRMSRSGEITAQPERHLESPTSIMGTHEDRVYRVTKDIQVPAGEGKSHDLEHVHLRSYLKSKAKEANLKYNERDMVGAVYHAKVNDPAKFEQIKKEALTHRTKRIGQVTEQRERAVAKKKQDRAMALESGAPKRQTAKAIRVKSNVSNRFTPAPNGTPKA